MTPGRHIHNKKGKLYRLFELIECDQLPQIRAFFAQHPELLADKSLIKAPNDWTPSYYAARFGYLDMLRYFIEELKLADKSLDSLHFLILLNIHSDNLEVNYYLLRSYQLRPQNLYLFFSNANMMKKFKLSLCFMRLKVMICDDVTYRQSYAQEGVEICYNLSYALGPDRKKAFFDAAGRCMAEEELRPDKEGERKVLFLSQSIQRKNTELLRTIEKFKHIGLEIYAQLEADGAQQKAQCPVSWFQLIRAVKESPALRLLLDVYNGVKTGD